MGENEFPDEILCFSFPRFPPLLQQLTGPSHVASHVCLLFWVIQRSEISPFFSISFPYFLNTLGFPNTGVSFLFLKPSFYHVTTCPTSVWPPCQFKQQGFFLSLLHSSLDSSWSLQLPAMFYFYWPFNTKMLPIHELLFRSIPKWFLLLRLETQRQDPFSLYQFYTQSSGLRTNMVIPSFK